MSGSKRLDARLLPAAAGVWAITAAAPSLGAEACVGVGVAGGLGCAAMLVVRLRWAAGVALALGFVAAAAAALAVRLHVRDLSPLVDLASDRAVATARVRLTADPRAMAGGFGPDRVAVEGTATDVIARGNRWRLSEPVTIFADAGDWGELVPSQRVTVFAELRPVYAGDLDTAVLIARGPPRDVSDPSPVQRGAGRLRTGLRDAASGLPAGARGLVPGLVDGDVSRMPEQLTADFRTTGLTHLTAVSGANVAIVCGAVLFAVRRGLRLGPRVSAVLAGLALAGFVILARPQPSVVRAGVMGGLALAALASGRRRAALPALSAAVILVVGAQPAMARSIGFALSVLATVALLLVAPPLARWVARHGVPMWLAAAIAVPVAAHLVTAPLIASISGQVSLVAIPANLLVAPAVAPATILGVVVALVSPISGSLARAVAWLASWPVRWLVAVATRGAAVPDAALAWPSGARGALLLAVVMAGGAAVLIRSRPVRHVAAASALGVGLVAFPLRWISPGWPPPGWVIAACDVGEGDGLVIRVGGGAGIVIDTGTEPAVDDACLRGLGVRRVPLLVITHLHADHVGGVTGAMHGRPVGAIVTGPLRDPPGAWRDLVQAAATRGLPVLQPHPGKSWQIGPVQLTVLAPRAAFHDTHSDPNNSSLILRARAAGHTILLAGDAEIETERAMLRDHVDVRADILKVGHHGSAYFDPRFVESVGARLAIISVGARNDYGHPAPSLLSELSADGMSIARTDRLGDLAVTATGPEHNLAVVGHHGAVRTRSPGRGTGALPPAPELRSDRRATMVGCLTTRCSPPCDWLPARRSCSSRVRSPTSFGPRAPPIRTPTSAASRPPEPSWPT